MSGAWSNTWELYDIFHQRGLAELARKAYAPHNIYWLNTWGGADSCLMTTKKINTLEDLDGMKIRIAGEPQELLKHYGASIVKVPFAEFYLALQQGIIDGIGTMPSYMVDMKLGEVVDYLTFPAIKRDSCPMLINLDSWNELPDDLKLMMSDEYTWGPFLFKHAQELDYEQDMVARIAARDYGVEVSYLPDSEIEKMRQTAREVTWPWVANMDPLNAEAVKMIEQQMKDVGKL